MRAAVPIRARRIHLLLNGVFGPIQRCSLMNPVLTVQIRARVDQHSNRIERSGRDRVMQSRGVGLVPAADRGRVDVAGNHSAQRLGVTMHRGLNQCVLCLKWLHRVRSRIPSSILRLERGLLSRRCGA